MTPLLAGFGLGFSVAASFGPINLFALSSGLRYGFWPAYGVGVGAAVADGSYAFLGGLGAAALFTGGAKGWFQMLGGTALVFIAVGMVKRWPKERGEQRGAPGFGRSFTIALGATLANPITVVYWTAVFAGVVPNLEVSRLQALTLLPAGVVCGTVVWATLLAVGSAFARRYVNERLLSRLSLASALTIAGFGVWFIVSGLRTIA
jgi:threonine/homoserine/homoserine lactone efflux protein